MKEWFMNLWKKQIIRYIAVALASAVAFGLGGFFIGKSVKNNLSVDNVANNSSGGAGDSGLLNGENNQKYSSEGVMYEVSGDGTYAEVVGYTGNGGAVTIEETYNNLPVKHIRQNAFYMLDSMTSILIPDSVTSIDMCAFYCCSGLTEIILPNGITSIGMQAFSTCANLKYNEYNNINYLGNEENPYLAAASVVSKDLTFFEIHNDTKFLLYELFLRCFKLTEVVIPDGVISIGCRAFHKCHSLKQLILPDSVVIIDAEAFEDCTIAEIIIPSSVTSIGIKAFSRCIHLEKVVLSDGVESIGRGAFYGCESLTEIIIPNSVTSIGGYAFYDCSSLTSLMFRGTVEEWNAIKKGEHWNIGIPVTEIVCIGGSVSVQ